MALDYNELKTTADDLLQEFGVLVTFRSLVAGTYTASSGSVAGADISDVSVYAAFVPWDEIYIDGSKYEWHKEYHEGTGVLLNDIRCLLSAKGITTPPKPGDAVIASGTKYQVIAVKPIQPALIPVLYDLQLRS